MPPDPFNPRSVRDAYSAVADDYEAAFADDLERLPEGLRCLTPGASYPVTVADALVRLAADVDRRLAS